MKRIVSLLLAVVLCFTLGISAVASDKSNTNDSKCIVISNQDEMLDFLNSKDYHPGEKYSFFQPSSVPTRAICYNCGRPGLQLGTYDEEWSSKRVPCPVEMWPTGKDGMTWYKVWDVEKCVNCGMNNKIKQTGNKYTVTCGVDALGRTYICVPGATLEQGYDAHECMVW